MTRETFEVTTILHEVGKANCNAAAPLRSRLGGSAHFAKIRAQNASRQFMILYVIATAIKATICRLELGYTGYEIRERRKNYDDGGK